MSSPAFADELACATALARQAGRAALAYYGVATPVTYKAGGKGPVTAADEEANAIIVRGLMAQFPDDAILAEESPASHDPASRRQHRRLWCVDPIDGTREFVEGSGQFAVMVGLAVAGSAVLGVVYNPLTDSLWRGVVQQDQVHFAEVVCRGQALPLQSSFTAAAHQARLVVSNRGPGKAVDWLCRALGIDASEAAGQVERLGSVGLKVAWVAAGRADVYVAATDMVHEWDTCGPEAILRAAGGRVTDLFGAPLRYNKEATRTLRGMVASNGPLHAPVLAALARGAADVPNLRRLRDGR